MIATTTLPLRLVSPNAVRGHWGGHVKHQRNEHGLARLVMTPALRSLRDNPRPCVVTLTRLGPRTLDNDNLLGACKWVRDGVAKALGLDDADPRIEWRYAQQKSKTYGVTIFVEASDAP